MPILIDQQRRSYEVGIIRIGEKAESKDGKLYPVSRQTFRFTTSTDSIAQMVAATYGGTARPWKEGKRAGFEVVTEAKEIKALVSTSRLAHGDFESLSQSFESWSGNINARLCDGVTCKIWENKVRVSKPCICLPLEEDFYERQQSDKKLCRIKTRLSVILTEVPSIGTWRFNTGSRHFNSEAYALLETLANASGNSGQVFPITLKIEFREKRSAPGEATSIYPVVAMCLDANPVNFADSIATVQRKALSGSASLPRVDPVEDNIGFAELPVPEAKVVEVIAFEEAEEATLIEDSEDDEASLMDWSIATFGLQTHRDLLSACVGDNVDPIALLMKARAKRITSFDTVMKAFQRLRHNQI